MKSMSRAAWAVAVVLAVLAAGGCSGPVPFNVEVSLSEADTGLRDKIGEVRTIEVDLVAVNDTELSRWEQILVSEYWEPDNPLAASAKKHIMRFGAGHPNKQVLKKDDPIWDTWLKEREARHLVVLAFMPWISAAQAGSADPRRIILPLEVKLWEGYAWGRDTIPVELRFGGMVPLRQPKRK